MPELAAELTHAGAEPHEALELAALLERAAEPARFDVDVESALARVRPRPRRVLRPVLGVAALAAAAVVLVLALPFSHAPGADVQARALAAVGGPNEVLHLRESIWTRIPGAEQQERDVWIDPSRRRVAWTQSYQGQRHRARACRAGPVRALRRARRRAARRDVVPSPRERLCGAGRSRVALPRRAGRRDRADRVRTTFATRGVRSSPLRGSSRSCSSTRRRSCRG